MADYVLSAKITGDSSGFEKAFSAAQSTVNNFEKKLQGIGKSVSEAGDKLSKYITTPAVAATTALTGITLVKGFNRLTGIDDAKAKLKGLGHDADSVTEIMNSALASVKGTSYGMDEAATTAASAVAAGIKPGQELTKYLGMTADAAAIAGISMSEMGSIINKVQTGQTAYTEDLDQLADRGLPIYQWLAKEAGVAASEVKGLASDGQISSEMLFNAIQKNIGGAAKIMGESSFTAAISNIGATIGRIGANFLDAGGKGGGFFSTLKPMLSDFNNRLGELESVASDLGVRFGEAFSNVVSKVQDLKARFDGLSPSIQSLIIKGAGIGAAIAVGIGPALKILGPMISSFGTVAKVIGAVASPVGLVVTAVAALAAGFVYLMATNEAFREKVIGIWQDIQAVAAPLMDSIKEKCASIFDGLVQAATNLAPTFQSIFSTISSVVGTVVEALKVFFSGIDSGFSSGLGSANGFQTGIMAMLGLISPPLKTILMLFQNFGPQIQTLVSTVVSSLVPVFATLGTTIGGIASAILPAMQSALANLVPLIADIIVAATQIVTTVLPVVVSLITQLAPFLVQIAQMVGQIVAALAPMVAQLVGALLPVITNIVTVVANVIQSIMPALIAILNVVMSVIQAIVPVITDIVSVVVSVVSSIISAISPVISFIGGVITAIMAVITPIVTFVANIIATVIRVIGTIVSTVTGIFATVYSVISGAFKKASDFVSKIINTISKVISTLTGIVSGVFNGIYANVSSVMTNVGNFIRGIFSGIQSAWTGLTSFVGGIFGGVSSAVSNLVGTVKGFVNDVIGGINWAVDLINKIPGVSIGYIPYLLHGTDDWSGGFARMNEGGRGELTYLPDGSRVIPHDISMKYAKESAKATTATSGRMEIDYEKLAGMMVDALSGMSVENNLTLNGKTMAREITPLINQRLNKLADRDKRR